MTTRIIKLSSAGIAAVLLLAACTSAGAESPPTSSTAATSSTAPAPTTTAPPSTTVSPTTSQGPVEVPKAATQRTEAGAIAFVRHYLDTFNSVSVTPREGELRALSEPGCKTCAGQEETEAYFVKYQQHYASTPIRVDRVAASPEADPAKPPYRVLVDVTMLGAKIVDASGKAVKADRARQGTVSFYLAWTAGTWKVSEIKFVG